MHVVIDCVAVRPGSAAIVVEHLIRAWVDLQTGDRLTVLAPAEGVPFEVPAAVRVVPLSTRLPGVAGGLWLRSVAVRVAAHRLSADFVLSGVPASTLLGAPAPRGLILYDLRHRLRPHQFSRSARLARKLTWSRAMRGTDAIFCISQRTLDDLRDEYPRLARRGQAALLGADHVDTWPAPVAAAAPYAIAFGHFANKNARAVIGGWAEFCATSTVAPTTAQWTLRLVGMNASDREAATTQVAELGIAERVELMPWLDDDDFAACFSSAALVLFPSDFEGFGLPAIEALRLGIPTVVSADPALMEVTGGHAIVTRSTSAVDLAAAISDALKVGPEQRAAGRSFTDHFSWRTTARSIRATALELCSDQA